MPVAQELLLDWLHPLLLRVADGSTLDWNLQARFQVGEQLPPFNRDGDGGAGVESICAPACGLDGAV